MSATGTEPQLRVSGLAKTFTLHAQAGARIPVFRDVTLEVAAGECVALTGPSGAGKSTLLRTLYANYKPSAGAVCVRHAGEWVDLTQAIARVVLDIRRDTIGYVSQFLRVIPRVSALDIVAEPLRAAGAAPDAAREAAAALLAQLDLPSALHALPPLTFSGGEQQRVNIARGLIRPYPVLLLDEPTASLDADNRKRAVRLIEGARQRGAAIVGIFHDDEVREALATREFDVTRFAAAA